MLWRWEITLVNSAAVQIRKWLGESLPGRLAVRAGAVEGWEFLDSEGEAERQVVVCDDKVTQVDESRGCGPDGFCVSAVCVVGGAMRVGCRVPGRQGRGGAEVCACLWWFAREALD